MSYAMDAQLSSASVAELVAWRAEKDRLHEERVKAERKRAEKERLARSVYNDRVARWATLDAQIAESFAGVDVGAFHRDAQLYGECDWTHVPLIGGEEAMEAQQAVFDSEAKARADLLATDFDEVLESRAHAEGDSVALNWRKCARKFQHV
ncbi:hypothetical protein Pmar_PMAR023428 [Perkinsus marinus ATCC 50983]|uniref:Uncharacterized protein n=1 Tax=Perkinsus marinus (strain ATCC 50983 / TXsc) TaxID=423536 RepID=C5KKJ0_PERM5|nr:hypothetical protein Pmar_PMAR023428 [Perkinsus marinus ATCC 50983]EER15102.1 hypothetical protein Pmar_PMAR023428 [Perkinsus marinus ATCC 50983]|eukprot:XP_002783306.1 hypothetical protein Pmar_PMAR023428 [Perkinsus marinus ATCC 50983]